MSKGRLFLVVINGLPIKLNRKQTTITFPCYEEFFPHVSMREIEEKDKLPRKHRFVTFLIDDGVLNIDHFMGSKKEDFRDGKLYCSFYVNEVVGKATNLDHIIPAETFQFPFVTTMENIIDVLSQMLRAKEVE